MLGSLQQMNCTSLIYKRCSSSQGFLSGTMQLFVCSFASISSNLFNKIKVLNEILLLGKNTSYTH